MYPVVSVDQKTRKDTVPRAMFSETFPWNFTDEHLTVIRTDNPRERVQTYLLVFSKG